MFGSAGLAQSNLPLDRAARAGDLGEVKRLISEGANPNETNKWGYTALTGACSLGADTKAHTDIVRYLITHGADVNKRVMDGTTALNEAAFWGHRETVLVLLNAKADVNQTKDNGYTPLISAASEGHLAIVKLLVEAGADLNRQNTGGHTALHMASARDHREIVAALLAAGARKDLKNVRGETYEAVAGRTKGLNLR
jgi:cytohesin